MDRANMKVLVVDDMSTMRKLLKKNLTALGFENLRDAEDGNKAWEAMNSFGDIDMVISDWNMPNCTGIDLLKRVRADHRFKHIPFIMVTAEGEGHQVKEALESGVSNYVLKPFTKESLESKISQTLAKLAAA